MAPPSELPRTGNTQSPTKSNTEEKNKMTLTPLPKTQTPHISSHEPTPTTKSTFTHAQIDSNSFSIPSYDLSELSDESNMERWQVTILGISREKEKQTKQGIFCF